MKCSWWDSHPLVYQVNWFSTNISWTAALILMMYYIYTVYCNSTIIIKCSIKVPANTQCNIHVRLQIFDIPIKSQLQQEKEVDSFSFLDFTRLRLGSRKFCTGCCFNWQSSNHRPPPSTVSAQTAVGHTNHHIQTSHTSFTLKSLQTRAPIQIPCGSLQVCFVFFSFLLTLFFSHL